MALSLNTFAVGDTNYIGKHNANYAAIQEELNALEPQVQLSAEKGIANGYCPLGADGLVPAGLIPEHAHTAYEEKAAKGQPNGYCPLGPDGRVPAEYMPLVPLDEALVNMLRSTGYDMLTYWPGTVPPGQAVTRLLMLRPQYFLRDFTGCKARVHHASAVKHVFAIQREVPPTEPPLQLGTLTFEASQENGVFDSDTNLEPQLVWAATSLLHLVLLEPLSIDPDFYDLSVSWLSSRTPVVWTE